MSHASGQVPSPLTLAHNLADFLLDVGASSPDVTMGAITGASAGLSALADPGLRGDLSPPAAALAVGLDQGLGAALGLGKGLSAVGLDKIADLSVTAGDLAGYTADVVTDVTAAVPIVGLWLKSVTGVFSALAGALTKSTSQICQEAAAFYVVTPSGSMLSGSTVPADYFAREHNAGAKTLTGEDPPWVPGQGSVFASTDTNFYPSDRHFRSLFGMALMAVTEGAVMDDADPTASDWKTKPHHRDAFGHIWNPDANTHAAELLLLPIAKADQGHTDPRPGFRGKDTGQTYQTIFDGAKGSQRARMRATWRRFVHDRYELFADAWRRGVARGPYWTVAPKQDAGHGGHKKRGLPKLWRERFRNLRRGIEAAHRSGDGGAALWIIYSDLFASAFDRGYLSVPFVTAQLEESGFPCAPAMAETLGNFASSWRNTVHPAYAQGKAKLAPLVNGTPELSPAADLLLTRLRNLLEGNP